MVALTLECTGDDSSTAMATFTLPSDITFSKCTLHSVDVDVVSSATEHYSTKAETDDAPVAGRDVYSPLYLGCGLPDRLLLATILPLCALCDTVPSHVEHATY